MKKFFAIFICIATALIFVACTNNSETKSSKTETTQISAQNRGGEKSFASIEDYINAEETQKAIDSMKKSYECMYDFDCYAEDNKFVYEYKYLETVGDEALPQIKKAFDEKFEEMKSTVKPLMEQLLGNVKEENPIVVLRFCNSDGSVISEKEYDKTVLDEFVSEN